MIHALDSLVVAATAPESAAADCERVLGRRASGGIVRLANMALELRRANGGAEGLAGLAFAVDSLAKAQTLLERRGLVMETGQGAPTSVQLAPRSTHQVPIALAERQGVGSPVSPTLEGVDELAAVSGLDHVVIRSPNPERAIALYAGRLGLSLRLDRSNPDWGARLLFFRCGDLVIEIAHDLKAGIGDGPDHLWGLSWRVPDIARAQARLKGAGISVSEVRTGRRPGTQVFTVKSHTAGVPTLVIGMSADAPRGS